MLKSEAEVIAHNYDSLIPSQVEDEETDEKVAVEAPAESEQETHAQSEKAPAESEEAPDQQERAPVHSEEPKWTPVLSEESEVSPVHSEVQLGVAPVRSEDSEVAPVHSEGSEAAPVHSEETMAATAQTDEKTSKVPAQTEETREAPVQTEEVPAQREEAPGQTTNAPTQTELAPVQFDVALEQTELSSLENDMRDEAKRNLDTGKTEEEENVAPVSRTEDEEDLPPVIEEVKTEESSDDNPLGIDSETLPYIWGDKKNLVGTDAWKLGPLGLDLQYFEKTIRSKMLPYNTRKVENSAEESCEGRHVYVYDLPPEFNKELVGMCDHLFPWFNLCSYVTDSGRGVPVNSMDDGKQIFVPGDRWFNTHQYALEMISHARILKHRCRTEDRSKANLFYVPYYAGLDIIRWHFDPSTTNEKKDVLSLQLVRWLQEQAEFRRHNGKDHMLVLGKISWDFRRQPGQNWGSRMLSLPELKDVRRLLIERDPWCDHDIGVPHPTYFHPQSAAEIDTWLAHVRSQQRPHLVTFVGKERKNDPKNPRTALVRQCMNVSSEADCKFVECTGDKCLHPAFVTKAFLATDFCMQPVGDSPTRRSVFDSLIAGCIPVLFHPQTAYTQYPWHLPRNETMWSVYIPEEDVIKGTVSVIDTLKKITVAQRDAMRNYIINTMVPGLIYSAPGADVSPYRDAFDISMDQVFHLVQLQLDSNQSH